MLMLSVAAAALKSAEKGTSQRFLVSRNWAGDEGLTGWKFVDAP